MPITLPGDNLGSEGDLNTSPNRQRWTREHLHEETLGWLAEDSEHFLHQSLSTPCLNVLARCDDIYIEDIEGRRYMDFHGNNVHQVGFGHPRVIERIKRQLDELPFCTRRYTNAVAIELARRLTSLAPGDPEPLAPEGYQPRKSGARDQLLPIVRQRAA